jgi:hypothetical protein
LANDTVFLDAISATAQESETLPPTSGRGALEEVHSAEEFEVHSTRFYC